MTSQDLPARALSALAADINAAHEACAGAVRAGLAHAVRAGRLLLEAKARVPHGEWLPWVKRNCAFSERTAQAYMRVARGQLDATDPQRVARLSFRSALASLAAPREPHEQSEGAAHPPGPVSRPGRARGGWPAALRKGARPARPTTRAMTRTAEEFGPNGRLIGGFLERLEGLEFGVLAAAVERWRAGLSDRWHEADRAAAAAIDATKRHRERDAVFEAEFEIFRHADWRQGARGRPTKATAQYAATAALMALLVRDCLTPEHFETLYGPFDEAIPIADLGRAGRVGAV